MIRKLFPFLFKKSPDGIYHWFFVNWCRIITVGNHERCYSFKLNRVFIWEVDVDGANHLKQVEYNEKFLILTSEIDQRDIILINKTERIQELEGEYKELKSEKEKLSEDLSIANTKVDEQKKRIMRDSKDRVESEGLLNDEISKRDKAIGEFKEFIHQERNDFKSQRAEDFDQHNKNLEKLRKEMEMLDKDFVDVAKAMRIYRQDKDRPVKGFRIKG